MNDRCTDCGAESAPESPLRAVIWRVDEFTGERDRFDGLFCPSCWEKRREERGVRYV